MMRCVTEANARLAGGSYCYGSRRLVGIPRFKTVRTSATIYCVGGVSGSGKSTLIASHPALAFLPCFDVADAYHAAELQQVNITWRDALQALIKRATRWLERYPNESLVLEAFFRPGGLQREEIKKLADRLGHQAVFIWCHASRAECKARVLKDASSDTARRQAARLNFVRETADEWFLPQPGEEPDIVLGVPTSNCSYYSAELAEIDAEIDALALWQTLNKKYHGDNGHIST